MLPGFSAEVARTFATAEALDAAEASFDCRLPSGSRDSNAQRGALSYVQGKAEHSDAKHTTNA